MAGKAAAEMEIIREALAPVSQPRFFHFVMPKGRDWAGIVVGIGLSVVASFFTIFAFFDGSIVILTDLKLFANQRGPL